MCSMKSPMLEVTRILPSSLASRKSSWSSNSRSSGDWSTARTSCPRSRKAPPTTGPERWTSNISLTRLRCRPGDGLPCSDRGRAFASIPAAGCSLRGTGLSPRDTPGNKRGPHRAAAPSPGAPRAASHGPRPRGASRLPTRPSRAHYRRPPPVLGTPENYSGEPPHPQGLLGQPLKHPCLGDPCPIGLQLQQLLEVSPEPDRERPTLLYRYLDPSSSLRCIVA